MEQSSHDISQEIDTQEKELQKAITDQHTVEQEILIIGRKIIELQLEKKTLEMSRAKASHNRQILSSKLRTLRNDYFQVKGENR